MKKNKYIMISLSVILAIITLIIPNQTINADELDTKYLNYEDFESNYNKFSTQLLEARDYLIQYSNDYYYSILFSNNQIYVYLLKKTNSVTFQFKLETSSGYTSVYTYGGGSYIYSIDFYASNETDFNTKFETFKTNVENNKFNSTTNLISSSTTYNPDYPDDIKNTSLIIYDTNFDNYILSSASIYNLNVNGVVVTPGEQIPTYYNCMENSIFNKRYELYEYSKVEFDFDISDDVKTLDFYLDIFSGSYIYKPYIKYEYYVYNYNDNGELVPTGPYYKYTYLFNNLSYIYTFDGVFQLVPDEIVENSIVYTDFILNIDFGHLGGSYIDIALDSSLNYDVIEYTREDYPNQMAKIDLTNKKGALFVPKNVETEFNSNFDILGDLYLELRDSYSDIDYNVLERYSYGFCDVLLENNVEYSCYDSSKFNFIFGKNRLSKVVHIVNLNYSNDTYTHIYYESDKFDVYIIDNNTTNITIKDPFTNEDLNFNISNYESVSRAEIDIEYLIDLIEQFLNESDEPSELVKRVLFLFFNEMPEEIYQAFVVIMFVIFVCAVVMIVGWK